MKKYILLFCSCFLLMAKFATAQNINCNITATISPADTIVCLGTSVTLTASGGDSYAWSNGDTGSVITVSIATDSILTVIAKSGSCSDTTSAPIDIFPVTPIIILPNDTSICSGQAVILHATGGGVFYTWSPATGLNTTVGDSVLAAPSITTTYNVLGYDSFGCNVTGTDEVIVLPGSNTPVTISQHGDTLFSSSKHGNQWYHNDTLLVGDTSQYIVITTPGCYWVSVNSNTGCAISSDSTLCNAGINPVELKSSVQLFPNPVNDIEFIKINSSAGDLSNWNLQLSDVLGLVIYKTQSLNYLNEIDMSRMPPGMYFISITNQTGRAVFPVVKQE